MGLGGSLLSLVWARYFSAENLARGNFYILPGTALAPILFLLLNLVPAAVRVFLVPLLFVPLFGLSVLLSFQKLNKNLPVFQDDLRANINAESRPERRLLYSYFAYCPRMTSASHQQN